MAIATLIIFCVFLLICLLLELPLLYALLAGLVLFTAYAIRYGHSFRNSIKLIFKGIGNAKNILLCFVLIGMLTGLWRAAGTIPTIVCYCQKLIHPSVFLLMAFLLNCAISLLTGTAFGTAATMGVICGTMGAALQIPVYLTGGAVLSGVYFGDRCSPISTSALLVADLTKTNLHTNIKHMLRTGWVPFCITCGIYAVIGALTATSGELPDLSSIFGAEFRLSPVAVIPAVVLFALAALRVDVKLSMGISILTSLPICIFLQNMSVKELLPVFLSGFTAQNTQVSPMINGGGIWSMAKVGAIVCISSAYSGLFKETDLLDPIKKWVFKLSTHTSVFISVLTTSLVASAIACNQTLSIILTKQVCDKLENDKNRLALYLENTAVVISPLIPWSIAGAVPLASVGAPSLSILFAFFLMMLPVWNAFKTTKSVICE